MSYTDSADERATFLDEEKLNERVEAPGISPRTFKLLTICNVVFFVATLSLYASSWLHQPAVRNPQLRQFSSYCECISANSNSLASLILPAPLLDVVDLPLEVKTMNGTLYPSKHPSVGRGPPSPEVDAVWDEWEITRVYPITKAQIIAMGKDPTTATKLEVSAKPTSHLSQPCTDPSRTRTSAWETMHTLLYLTSTISCTA